MVLGDLHGIEVTSGDPLVEVGLVEGLAVDQHLPVLALDRVTGQANDPLDEVLDLAVGLALGALEHDDVARVHVVEAVAELVDEHPVADVEGRDHRRGRDEERLEEEGLDDQGDDERAAHHHDPFDQAADTGRSRCLGRLDRVAGVVEPEEGRFGAGHVGRRLLHCSAVAAALEHP